jgi:hypothetical protein
MARVVRETVVIAAAEVVDGAAVGVWADASAAMQRKTRDRFLMSSLDLGEIERFLIFNMVRDARWNEKAEKGCDFGNRFAVFRVTSRSPGERCDLLQIKIHEPGKLLRREVSERCGLPDVDA